LGKATVGSEAANALLAVVADQESINLLFLTKQVPLYCLHLKFMELSEWSTTAEETPHY
jgi:hypothetical protein